ncbi:MAG: hypothetical protein QM709_04765 [Spongiibacteraceae bacterium]
MKQNAAITLSTGQIAFLQGNVTMYAATANRAAQPHVAKLAGVRIDAATNQITVFLNAANADALLADIRGGSAIAVVFCEPGSEKAIQLKSHSADIVALQHGDHELMASYRDRLVQHIIPLGFSPEMLRCFFSAPLSEAIALQFTPCEAFDQTPGPKAGSALVSA